MAERLIGNHYATNRVPNGGYGHHEFSCDTDGPLAVKPKFTEAVWCCTFHGLLGLHTLKHFVVVGSDRGVFINFPLDVTAAAPVGKRTGTRRIDQGWGQRPAGSVGPCEQGRPRRLRLRPDHHADSVTQAARLEDAGSIGVYGDCFREVGYALKKTPIKWAPLGWRAVGVRRGSPAIGAGL